MTAAEFVYTIVLRPRPLRAMTDHILRSIVPDVLHRYGASVALNPNDPVVSGGLALGVYERAETKFFLGAFRPGMTFLDVGANVGYYTALALAASKNDVRIIALEPDAESFSFLQKTVAANGGGSRVTCVQKALSDSAGRATLFVNSKNRGDNRLYANELSDANSNVETIVGDALLKELNVSSLDFIKIDVQGYEGHVMRGLFEVIRNSSSLTLLSEFWPDGLQSAGTDPASYLSDLQGLGFELFQLEGNNHLEKITDIARFVARYKGRAYANIIGLKR